MALKKKELEELWDYQSHDLNQSIKDAILVPSGRGDRFAARDYIHANAIVAAAIKASSPERVASCKTFQELWTLIDSATRFRLRYYTPCLAFRYDEFKPEEQKSFFEDPDWVFTEKMNGARVWLVVHHGVVKLFSRNYSDVDCSVPDYWGNINQELVLDSDEVFAIDCEIMFEPGVLLQEELERYGISTDSRLEAVCALLQMNSKDALEIQRKFKAEKGFDLLAFRMIAPLFYKGKNYIKATLGEGQDIYDEVINAISAKGLNLKPISRCRGTKEEKESFLNTILASGGEGIVGHYRKGGYSTTEKRSKSSFVKLKRSVCGSAASAGLGDTIDGWISGFKMGTPGTANEGRIAAFEISVYIIKNGRTYEHIIAYVPNVAREIALAATVVHPDGTVTMDESFYNLVVEVDGQAISKVSKRLTHPRLLRYRADKGKEECIYTQEFIDSQIDTL